MNNFNKAMGRLAIAASLLLIAAGPLTAATLQAAERNLAAATPEQVGMTAAGVQKITTAMAKAVDDKHIAGVVTMMARHGKVVHTEAYGHQDLENNIAMDEDSIFRIFSMSKPITGVALMMLHEQGKFAFSDPVEKYIPEFANLQVAKADGPDGMPLLEAPQHKMTVQELMSHTGGLTYGFFSRSQTDSLYKKANILDRNSTLKEMTAKLATLPLKTQPGTRWEYSVSVDVQGYLVEVLSKQTFDAFLKEHIFTPLQMNDTAFSVAADKADRLARYYSPGAKGLTSKENSSYLQPPALFSGGGGLTSTAADYMRFAQMLANGGEFDGVRIISSASVDTLRSNKLPDNIAAIGGFYPGNQFGVDVALVTDSAKNNGMSVGSYWWWGVAGSWFWIDPVEDLIFVGMIQNTNLLYSIKLRGISQKLTYEAIEQSNQP